VPAANALSAKLGADVIFFNGDLHWTSSQAFLKACKARKQKKPDALFVLVTSGGNPKAAYRMARCLQRSYTKFWIFVPGWCKSAGTLIASGAHEIYMSDGAELGPLDIQLSKKDEVWTGRSGLVVDAAVRALEDVGERMFFHYLYEIKDQSSSVTYKTAAGIASDLVGRLLGPVFGQIDPAEVGENSRTMNITKEYATRLDRHAKNFKSKEWLSYLVESYPDHSFTIDRAEASEIFVNVKAPSLEMENLEQILGDLAVEPIDSDQLGAYEVRYLSEEPPGRLSVVESPGVAS